MASGFNGINSAIQANEKRITKVIVEDMAVKADQYAPEDTGKTRIEMLTDLLKNRVTWSNEYVEYIFWGITMNFQKTNNPKAQAMWTERATAENVDKWANDYADAIESGFK